METTLPWKTLSEVYGFLGNSLLKPMTQTAHAGLDPAFWEVFPDFGSEQVRNSLDALAAHARKAAELGEIAAAEQCAVEYTRLFVGPPSPAAPPWETLNRNADVTVGFGEATFQMRALLRDAGLELRNDNNQYEDHMGIELLYLSECCRRAQENEEGSDIAAIHAFVEEHPLSWIDAFRVRVAGAFPEGYFDCLLALAESILRWHLASMK